MNLKKYRLLVFCLVCYCRTLHAQNLGVSELVRMCKADVGHIDSLLGAKEYKKTMFQSIINYTYTGLEGGTPIMRAVHLGRPPHRKYWEIEYGVFQKSDAENFTGQIIKAGFTKKTLNIPDVGGSHPSAFTLYVKGDYSIRYREELPEGSAHTIYIFSIDVDE